MKLTAYDGVNTYSISTFHNCMLLQVGILLDNGESVS